MHNDILDHSEEKTTPKFANRAIKQLVFGLIIYGLIVFFNLNFRSEFDSRKIPAIFAVTLGSIALITSVVGIVNGVASILKKENALAKKYGSIIGNFLILLIMSLMLFANLIDLYVAFS